MALVTAGFSYDVFLSFRGEDTRHGFTGNLWKALNDRGIRTFMDDEELQEGEEITPSLVKAIEESNIAIVVLSKNYASSSFCLQELAKILDCTKDKGLLVWPVFYEVDPSDVRKLTGTYGEAMAMHEARYNDNMDKTLQKWKNALHQVANLPGFHYNNRFGYDIDEFKLIERNVEAVSWKVNGLLTSVPDSVLQISQRLPEVLQTSLSVSGVLQISPSDPEVLQTSPSISGVLQISPSDPKVLQTSPSVSGDLQISPSDPEVLQTSPSVSGVLQISPSDPEVSQTSPSVSVDLQISPSDPEVSQTSLRRVYEEDDKTWRNVGLLSSVVGLFCCALSPTFHRLIRGWNALKFFFYGVSCLVICTTIAFARQSAPSKQHLPRKIIGFAVLMFMAVYTLYYDKALNGKPDIPGLVSNAAFALVSLSLSKLINFGQEMGIFGFFLSCFVAQLWIINKMLILVAIVIGYPLFHMHSSSDSQPEVKFHSLNSRLDFGLVSSVVSLLCYALSPSFNREFGRWNSLKFILYGVLSLVICTTILFAKKPLRTQYVQLRSHISFAVLMIICVYSFYYDKDVDWKPETLSLVSNATFALVSLSLSKLVHELGFEMGIFSYFLGCFAVQLWTIHWWLILVAIIFGCPLFRMHSPSDSRFIDVHT